MNRLVFALAGYMFLAAGAAAAAEDIILSVDGKTAGGVQVEFTRTQLEGLGTQVTETSTPWYDGRTTFEGVPLGRLMETVGATGDVAFVVALNNYTTEIPLQDFAEHGVILALKRDGQYMAVSDKGPLFVIYPFDDKPELKDALYYARSAWQVRRITIK